ncbi:hypothetical protein HD806DRAFT_476847 [Xylariaceae sp. AK1471]|nr:hypothetical protein HD806DRAFT_476847 [Xylariaceae sp. AK1471]
MIPAELYDYNRATLSSHLEQTITDTMTRLRISKQSQTPSTGTEDRDTRSEPSSNNENFTPTSSASKPDHNQHATPSSAPNFHVSPDTPLPSIENAPNDEESYYLSTPSTSHARLPTVSLPPSEKMLTPTSDGRSVTYDRDSDIDSDINSLSARVEEMRFSTPRTVTDLSDVADVPPEGVTGGNDRRSSLLTPRSPGSVSPSPRLSSAYRRRSSSRNKIQPHEVKDESPPNDRFNDPGFQKAFGDTKKYMRQLVDVLGSSTVHDEPDSVMQRLHRQAESLAQFQSPTKRIVGFVGESEVGKSSLINSLLDYNLARTNGGGEACTCVVTEYHYHSAEREFAIETERLSQAEITTQLKDYLRDYRHFHMNRNSLDPDEVSYLEKRANHAIDTFRAMFRGLLVDESLLISNAASDVLSMLQNWAQRSAPSISSERQTRRDPEGCSLENVSTDGAVIWPWIKKVKIYVNSHVLSRGLVLVDLPGLRDSNTARCYIAERYLGKCDEIFVVCNIGRAATDVGVLGMVEMAKQAKLSNIGIICTKSDIIEFDEAKKDFRGQEAEEIQEKLNAFNREEATMTTLENEIALYDDTEPDNLADEDRDILNNLNREMRAARKRKEELIFDLRQVFIPKRNASVTAKLMQLYKNNVPGHSPYIFCVGNHMYRNYRGKPKDEAMRWLILSGILHVRKHCMGLVSECQYTAANNFMRDDIAELLGELGLWVQSGQGSLSGNQKQNIRRALDAAERKLQLELCGHTSKLNIIGKTYRQDFDTEIYDNRHARMRAWRVAARNASADWSCWAHQSYSAFCLHYGTHHTEGVGSRSWNGEIIEEMASDLSSPLEELDIGLDERNHQVITLTEKIFEEAVHFLDLTLEDCADTVSAVIYTLKSQGRVLANDIETIFDQFQSDLRTLRVDALSGLRGSNIGKIMEPAYESARSQRGDGSHSRKIAAINATVRRDGLFADLLRTFRKDFIELADEAQDNIQEAIESHLDSIRDTFNIVRDENAASEAERDPEFRHRVEGVVRTIKGEMERIYSAL